MGRRRRTAARRWWRPAQSEAGRGPPRTRRRAVMQQQLRAEQQAEGACYLQSSRKSQRPLPGVHTERSSASTIGTVKLAAVSLA